jgi:hydrogenase maturation protein HypF
MLIAAPRRSVPSGAEIRVRGIVQGVGFRPAVWRLATACGLTGRVRNDSAGVLIEAEGSDAAIERFLARLSAEAPPLARIDAIERAPLSGPLGAASFEIAASRAGTMTTAVAADAAICSDCRAEILSPFERRYRYPFANCTHCGPRFSIVERVPYDRALTTMAPFAMCPACAAEYAAPSDRRFHAQPIACHACGPRASIVRFDGRAISFEQHSMLDDVDAAGSLIAKGEIVAIKGLGGYHLACDATRADVVARLRAGKRRSNKPFALMARDLDVIGRFCRVSQAEQRLLEGPEAPIVVLEASGSERLPDAIAPGLGTLGFMLPYTPLHTLMLRRLARPVVMTSGNVSDEPQVTDDAEARAKLASIAAHALVHDRRIANRVDDSVVRVMAGAPRLLRRARGYAPATIALPRGFEAAPDLLAFGGELKATFCLVKNGAAILSQHQGDLEELAAFEDYQANLRLYGEMFEHRPQLLVADRHPEYLSRKLALEMGAARGLPVVDAQHHHAHIASCLAENGRALDAPAVIGVALDGVGFGEDGAIWGGEFLLADYRSCERLGTFKPVAMLGGAQAVREPWRNTYAHLMAEIGWPRFDMNYRELDLYAFLAARPRATLDRMLQTSMNSPLASSCGRLFDAVAAAVGLARASATFEGEGAMLLEAAVDETALRNEDEELAYPFSIPRLKGSGLPYIEPVAMWQALLGDMVLRTPVPIMAARFHRGLAKVIAAMVEKLATASAGDASPIDTVALSGGCFQNRVLLEETERRLCAAGFNVLMHAQVPAGDGGLALGQAAIAAARSIATREG